MDVGRANERKVRKVRLMIDEEEKEEKEEEKENVGFFSPNLSFWQPKKSKTRTKSYFFSKKIRFT